MPRYLVAGVGVKSKRRRERTYYAKNETEARGHAAADGTSIETIQELPEDPPTERQVAYARDLGIAVPHNATKAEVSDLLDVHLGHDKQADARHLAFAERFGAFYTQYSGKKALYNRIHAALVVPGREHELASWFAYRVYRELVNGRPDVSIQSPDDATIAGIATELAQDASIIKSIRRYQGDDLIWFGEWTAPDGFAHRGGSNNTIAYKRAAALLRERVGDELRKLAAPSTASTPRVQHRQEKAAGCMSVVAAMALGLGALGAGAWCIFTL